MDNVLGWSQLQKYTPKLRIYASTMDNYGFYGLKNHQNVFIVYLHIKLQRQQKQKMIHFVHQPVKT